MSESVSEWLSERASERANERGRERYREIQRDTERYREIQRDTEVQYEEGGSREGNFSRSSTTRASPFGSGFSESAFLSRLLPPARRGSWTRSPRTGRIAFPARTGSPPGCRAPAHGARVLTRADRAGCQAELGANFRGAQFARTSPSEWAA